MNSLEPTVFVCSDNIAPVIRKPDTLNNYKQLYSDLSHVLFMFPIFATNVNILIYYIKRPFRMKKV